MVDVNRFKTELELEIDKKLDGYMLDVTKNVLRASFTYIMQNWPAYTYYSMANNVITIRQPKQTPEPEDRPSYQGAMRNEALLAFQEGLDFIDNLKPFKTVKLHVFISNPVNYASDVSFESGKGDAIYEQAAVLGEAFANLGEPTQ